MNTDGTVRVLALAVHALLVVLVFACVRYQVPHVGGCLPPGYPLGTKGPPGGSLGGGPLRQAVSRIALK